MEGVQAALTPDEVLESEEALVRAGVGGGARQARCLSGLRCRAVLPASCHPCQLCHDGCPAATALTPRYAPQKRNPEFRALMAERFGITDVERQLAVDPWCGRHTL